MLRLIAVSVALAGLSISVFADIDYPSFTSSKRYTVTIRKTALENSPVWQEDADNPPLSARKAMQLADKTMEPLVGADNFTLQSAQLVRADRFNSDHKGKWYWLLHYGPATSDPTGSRLDHLRLVVLMDGTVVAPSVAERGE